MQKNINSFLQLGYFLDYKNPNLSFDFSGVDKEKYAGATEQELIEEGSRLWLEAISTSFRYNEKHLVPISGGLDSRAVLAGLLKHTDAKNIHTYTFGTPKTLDYEVGNFVAKKVGTKQTSFDLTQYQYTQEELEDISVRIDRQTILFHHAPIWKIDNIFKGLTLWSGLGGDVFTGVKYKKNESTSIESAFEKYFLDSKYVKSINLAAPTNLKQSYVNIIKPWQGVSYDELIAFESIVPKFEAAHVTLKGFDYKLPFLNKDFFDFMLSIPNKYREGQYLYKEILLHTFPKEFSWKTKTNLGLPLRASPARRFLKKVENKIAHTMRLKSKSINYLDFNYHIRNKPDLRAIISANVMDLKKRDIVNWIDPEKILNIHLSGKANHADALIVLASLEIHLKTGLKL